MVADAAMVATVGGGMDDWDIDESHGTQSTSVKHRKLGSARDKKDEMVRKILQLLTKFGLKIG